MRDTLKRLSLIPFKYNGRDESGLDCYGFVRMVYKIELGVELHSLLDVDASNLLSVSRRMRAESCAGHWHRVHDYMPFDVIVMKRIIKNMAGGVARLPVHVGIITDMNKVAHFEEGYGLLIEKLGSPCVANRISGVYRYVR